MSTERDTTRIVRSWLRTDEHESADRILDIVLDQLDTTPRRRSWWPAWRFANMNTYAKLAIGVAAAVVIAVVGINLLSRSSAVGGPNVAPTTQPSPSAAPASPAPTAARSGSTLGPAGVSLQVEDFPEPFTFTLPAFPSDPTFKRIGVGQAEISSPAWGVVYFHDDVSLPADMCKPANGTRIGDVPSTPDAVGDWLTSGAGLQVSAPVALTVDGRAALRWDVFGPVGVCDRTADQPAPWFGAGERHRIYAVPTGSDTILVMTLGINWSNGPDNERYLDEVNAATDELVQSMKFGG
jgi:hypothetical protein